MSDQVQRFHFSDSPVRGELVQLAGSVEEVLERHILTVDSLDGVLHGSRKLAVRTAARQHRFPLAQQVDVTIALAHHVDRRVQVVPEVVRALRERRIAQHPDDEIASFVAGRDARENREHVRVL